MHHFILHLADGDQPAAQAQLQAQRWPVDSNERHRHALAPGDLALVFAGRPLAFVGSATLSSPWCEALPGPWPAKPAGNAALLSGVLLDQVLVWLQPVPLALAVQRIDPHGTNPYVQANAAGFRAGVVQITAMEYGAVLALHGDAGHAGALRLR